MELNISTIIMGLLGGILIAITGYLKSGEKFVLVKAVQTAVLGGIAGAVLGFTGVQVTDANLAVQILAFGGLSGGIALAVENILKWLGVLTSTTAKPIIVNENAPKSSGTTVPFTPTPAFPAGKAAILGIYGDSAKGNEPKASVSFDVNQVPQMFFDFQTLVTGKVIFSMFIDGLPLKDWSEQGAQLTNVGQKQSLGFWIPQKFRTVGGHVVTIRSGHLEGAENITPGGSDSYVVYDASQDFAMAFTGVKSQTE